MSSKYLMSVDVGGSNIRCLLLDVETGRSTYSVAQDKISNPVGETTFGYSLDTDKIWNLVGSLSKEVLAKANATPDEISGIATTSMRHGTVLLGADGTVLFATPNLDARASTQGMELAMDHGSTFFERTGHWPCPIMTAPRLMWLKKHDPHTFEKGDTVLSISDWLGFRLSGQVRSERSQAAAAMLVDLKSREWAKELITQCDIPLEWFAPLADGGSKLGELSESAAAHLGLPVGIPVAVGGADTQCALLGLGVHRPGELGVVSGSTAPIQLVTEGPVLDEKMRVWTGLHVVPGRYVLESNAGGIGYSLDWLAKALYPEHPKGVDSMMAEAAQVQAGVKRVFSTVGADLFNAREMRLPVDSLTFSTLENFSDGTNRQVLSRAVLEGMAYSVKANVEQLLEVSQLRLDSIALGGGMTQGAVFRALISEALGRKCQVGELPESSALGAAICAGVGAGVYRDLISGAKALGHGSETVEPSSTNVQAYSGLYDDWNQLLAKREEADLLASDFLTEEMLKQKTNNDTNNAPQFKPRIYVSADMDQKSILRLNSIGEVTYASYRDVETLLVGEDLIDTLAGYHVFVTEVDVLDLEAIKGLPDLRLVFSCRGNPVNIDIAACTAAGIPVINTPGRNATAVAEATIAYMLTLSRKLQEASAFLRKPGGEAGDMGRMGMAHYQLQGHELWHKTLGIVGAGAVGKEVIKRALSFGMRIIVHDPPVGADEITLLGAEKTTLPGLLQESDFISLHAPLTDDTRSMLDSEAFAQMKKGAVLVNTARAGLVDQEALQDALESQKIGGAALDVFAVEPPASDDPLLGFSNVIATPHIAGNTFEIAEHQGAIVAEALSEAVRGEWTGNVLNRDALDGFTWTEKRTLSKKQLHELSDKPGPGVSDLDVAASPKSSTPLAKGLLSRLFKKAAPKETAPKMDVVSTQNTGATHERMTAILEVFTKHVSEAPALQAFAKGRDVIFNITVKDMDIAFFMAFCNGEVQSGLGAPPRDPEVNLKMTAHTLDGMFTGNINPTRAAMTGKLSFSGDTAKAMAFQRALKDIQALYRRAREEVGGPGDLKDTSKAIEPPQKSKPPVQVAPTASNVGDVRDEILEVTTELFAKGYITPTGGNISSRVDEHPNEAWITPSQIYKGDLRPDSMVKIDLNGKLIGENQYEASSERKVHCAIFRTRPDIQAVIHTHAKHATLMALTDTKFLPISTEAAFIGEIPVVPFVMPGSDELGDAVAEALGEGCAVIMQNHGLVVAASSLRRAADVTDIIEATAEKILACKALGITPPVLPPNVVKTLEEIGEMMV